MVSKCQKSENFDVRKKWEIFSFWSVKSLFLLMLMLYSSKYHYSKFFYFVVLNFYFVSFLRFLKNVYYFINKKKSWSSLLPRCPTFPRKTTGASTRNRGDSVAGVEASCHSLWLFDHDCWNVCVFPTFHKKTTGKLQGFNAK